ncbi:MAG: ankyrin repeat domain-containing protein [Gemmataceae bacterium]
MPKQNALSPKVWFENCGGWNPTHDMDILRRGVRQGMLDEQDEYGMTALSLGVMSDWYQGVEELLQSGANTELRYFRTGETALYMAVQQRNERIVAALVATGANPDAPNYWGLTARNWATRSGSTCFDQVPTKEMPLPPPRIQNAEHLSDHYHPRFKIPVREEREKMQVGQAVDLYVYGPKVQAKQDTVKVRITSITGKSPSVRYTGEVETLIELTHLAVDTTVLEFGPENIASVYVAGPKKNTGRTKL